MNAILVSVAGLSAIGSLLQPVCAAESQPLVTTQPDPSADVVPYFVSDADARWSSADWSKEDIEALRQKVKYVFVIFNENRSFDHEYGTFPGVNGIYSDGRKPRSPADTPGIHPSLCRCCRRQDGHGSAISHRARAELHLQGHHRSFARSRRGEDRRQGRRCAHGQVRRGGVAPLCAFRQRRGRSDGNAVRPPGDGAYRLRHDSVLLALRQPLHNLRQHLRHRGRAFDPQRHRHDRGPGRRDAVG